MNLINQFFSPFQPPDGHPRDNRRPQYQDFLQAFPAYMMERFDLEEGNKILLPPSALQMLSSHNVPYPMIFCILNSHNGKSTFVGVLEFVAADGKCFLPNWICENLDIVPSQEIIISLNCTIPKGKFVRIRPHQTAFIDLPDPRAILEVELRKYTCLTKGETIVINFLNKSYKLDILDVKPQTDCNCVCVIETDIELDFATPLDFQDHPNLQKKDSKIVYGEEGSNQEISNIPFSGKGVRLNGRAIDQKFEESKVSEPKDEYDPRKHKLQHGLSKKIINDDFKGKGTSIGSAKRVLNKKF